MYRTIDCTIWQDDWMRTLSPEASYLFIYLFTNHRATACGVYELTPGMMARETRLSPEAITAALAELAPKVRYWPDLDVVWVVNFYKRQQATSNAKFTASARRTLAQFAPEVQAAVWAHYPILNPTANPPPSATNPPSDGMLNGMDNGISIPIPNKDNSEQITANSEHAGAEADDDPEWNAVGKGRNHDLPTRLQSVPKPTHEQATMDAFQPVMDAYPCRLGVLPDYEGGLAAFAAIPAADWPRVLVGTQAFAEHEDATKENGRYVPSLPRFIAERWWTRYQPKPAPDLSAPPPRAPWLVELDARRAANAARKQAAAAQAAGNLSA